MANMANMTKEINYVENMKQLGMNLKRARESTELTQEKVGWAIGLNRSSLAYYELGRTIPTIFTLIKLSKIYNVDLLDLVTI